MRQDTGHAECRLPQPQRREGTCGRAHGQECSSTAAAWGRYVLLCRQCPDLPYAHRYDCQWSGRSFSALHAVSGVVSAPPLSQAAESTSPYCQRWRSWFEQRTATGDRLRRLPVSAARRGGDPLRQGTQSRSGCVARSLSSHAPSIARNGGSVFRF